MNTIDAKLLARMFLAGAKNLEVKKEWINELNVFPVPDGDTGTNMTLTIMSAVKEVNNLEDVLEEGRRVLAKTPDMLPVLKEAGVVDSGGQGLMVVLEGDFDAFMGKEVDLTFDGGESAKVVKITPQAEADIKFGYCTEFIIVLNKEFTAEDEVDFKAYLSSLGDSIVCVADDEVVKIHVHTNDPGLAIQRALTYGSLSRIKIDNIYDLCGIQRQGRNGWQRV